MWNDEKKNNSRVKLTGVGNLIRATSFCSFIEFHRGCIVNSVAIILTWVGSIMFLLCAPRMTSKDRPPSVQWAAVNIQSEAIMVAPQNQASSTTRATCLYRSKFIENSSHQQQLCFLDWPWELMRNGFYSADDAFRLLVLDLSANTLNVKHIDKSFFWVVESKLDASSNLSYRECWKCERVCQ